MRPFLIRRGIRCYLTNFPVPICREFRRNHLIYRAKEQSLATGHSRWTVALNFCGWAASFPKTRSKCRVAGDWLLAW